MPETLTLAEIETAYIQAAKIVHRYGDVYLPIFERLEFELEEYKRKVGNNGFFEDGKYSIVIFPTCLENGESFFQFLNLGFKLFKRIAIAIVLSNITKNLLPIWV